MNSIKVEYLNYTVLYFNNPNQVCLKCDSWAPGFIAGRRKLKLWPCGHKTDFKSACPTWNYKYGCICKHEQHLHTAEQALEKVNNPK